MPPKIPFLKGTIKSQLPVETAYQPKQAGLCRAGPESAFSREEASSLTKGCCHTKTGRVSTVSKDNSGLVEIVRRHFHIHFIADADSDEILPHFSGDVSQHLMPVGQSNSKHGTWQNRCDRSLQCYGFFFRHKAFLLLYLTKRRTMTRPGVESNKKKSADKSALFLIWRQPTLAQAIQALPSAMRRLTAEFGMGSGRATASWSPKIFQRTHVP
jgi:hypothetical protein